MEEQRGAVASTINVNVQMSAGIPYLGRSSAHMLRHRNLTRWGLSSLECLTPGPFLSPLNNIRIFRLYSLLHKKMAQNKGMKIDLSNLHSSYLFEDLITH